MWYWGENGRQHVGKVIAAGAENNHVPAIMGWDRTDTLSEAIEEARGFIGRGASDLVRSHSPDSADRRHALI